MIAAKSFWIGQSNSHFSISAQGIQQPANVSQWEKSLNERSLALRNKSLQYVCLPYLKDNYTEQLIYERKIFNGRG